MASTSPCKRCDKSGLPILLVRPTAIAKDAGLAPPGAASLKTHEDSVKALKLPELGQSCYALRLLRQGGYVYVYYPGKTPKRLLGRRWQVYRVVGSGGLLPEGEFSFEKADAVCNRKATHPHDLRTVCIDEPAEVGTVWIGFSMNWWNDAVKAQVLKDLQAAGMVKVDLTQASQPSGFQAEATLIRQHVADYALNDLRHAKVDCATPFYGSSAAQAGQGAEAKQAQPDTAATLVQVMNKQAQASTQTQGKAQVLVIPDPVGLAADLNGIRIAQDKALKEALANSPDARALASDAALRGLEEAIRAVGAVRAQSEAYGSTSQARWDSIKNTVYIREFGYQWEPAADGSLARDGSPNGRLIGPPNARRERHIEQRGRHLGERDWGSISRELDEARRQQQVDKAKSRIEQDAQRLRPYEVDWLNAMKANATLNYFKCHYDESDSNTLVAPVSPGAIYSAESECIHVPHPLSSDSLYEQYLSHLLDHPITDSRAVALRAMFGNQKTVIEQVHGLLSGDAGRGNEGNMRDKTYDLVRGLITTEGGRRYAWMTDAVAAYAGGQHMALGAAAFLLLRGNPERARTWLHKLPQLSLSHNTLLMAIETTLHGGKLNMPILIQRQVTAAQALKRIDAAPAGQYSQRDRAAARRNEVGEGRRVTVLELADVNTESGAVQRRPGEAPRMQGHAKGAPSTREFEALRTRAQAVGAVTTTEAALEKVQDWRKLEAANLMAEGRIDQRLGVGGMVVQAIGLWQALPQLMKEINGPGGRQLRDAALSVADGVSGFTGAAADTLAGAHKAALMQQAAGKHLVRMSTRLAVLKTVAGLAGVAGGALNAVMSAYKAEEAEKVGDVAAYYAYGVAAYMFVGTALSSTFAAGDAASKGAVSRFIARRVVLRAAGAVAAEALATAAAGVASFVSGVGLVLLVVGIGATVFAVVTTRTELQRWAARSYFGKGDGKPPFATVAEEDAALDKALGIVPSETVRGVVLLEREYAADAPMLG